MDSANNARSHHNQETHSQEEFTSFGSEEVPLANLFLESNEETTYNADHNNTTVPTNLRYSEKSEFKQPSKDKKSANSEDIEEEPDLEPQDLLIWALKHNRFERFSSLLELPGVDPKCKYEKPHYTTCIELACRLHWGGKFVKILLERGVKPSVHEIHQEPIHYAAKYGNPEALEALLQNKKNKINVVDSSGRTALHHTIKYSQKGRDAEYERCIELLLKRPDLALNTPNNIGYTPVHEAANSNKKAVELILKYRKDDVDLD
jgi:ankyrin repeat protein